FTVGDSVVAVASGCFANRVRVAACLVAPKPANLTFEQAAAVPIVFLTADYGLNDVARLQPGETVLVHAAAGGVGQAAIQIARRIGARVMGTASPEKHEFLRGQGVENVFHSRNLSFVEGVRAATDGEGVDVVLNSLAGEFIPRSLELLKPEGRFVEIGKKDIFQNEALDMHAFRASVSFHAVDLARVVARRPIWIGERLRAILKLFEMGEFVPPATRPFPFSAVKDAFRLMAQGKHRGKLVLTSEQPAEVLRSAGPLVRADASYLISGGLSGFGLATARWLVAQGARHLVLLGRGGARTIDAVEALDEFKQQGVQVHVARCDVTDRAALDAVIAEVERSMPPLRGVVHSAMVLQDEPLAKLTHAALEKVLAPKVQGGWNLHQATRPRDLDWFVMYSSCATLFGSAAQASYVAANRFLDALAAYRRAEGLPALTINWGPLADFGVVADNTALARYLKGLGLEVVTGDEAFLFLPFLLRREVTGAGVINVDWATFGDAQAKVRSSHRYSTLMASLGSDVALGSGEGLRQQLRRAAPPERRTLLRTYLRRSLAGVLGVEEKTLEDGAPLGQIGLDSLMAFELKVKIDKELKLTLPLDRLVSETKIGELPDLVLVLLDEPGEAPARPAAERAAATPASLDLHDSDDDFFQVVSGSEAARALEGMRFDGAALAYLPDKMATVGKLTDVQLRALFGTEPFVSHFYDTPVGRIAIVMLPFRSQALFRQDEVREPILRALELAGRHGARTVSLTGLVPSLTGYGKDIATWSKDRPGCPALTTGHATTTAAVIRNLDQMLELAGRNLESESLAVLGLGSIGQSCLRLMLEVLPHPRELVLCDVFAKERAWQDFAEVIRAEHGYRGPIRLASSREGAPAEVYAASTILTAVSVPNVLDVDRLQPGTLLLDDSYPPAFRLEEAVKRLETDADVFFSNAGMLRLSAPLRETLLVPAGAEGLLAHFGVATFREEGLRDPYELTACVLSSALTGRADGTFPATLGLADVRDLVAHYRELPVLDIGPARPQCDKYFVPKEAIERFRQRFGGRATSPPVPVGRATS
ncbi:MAG: SDR family NAD(P)-dependent oxidoreductase, partial [Gemmataceae bacterium]|nr:SDR family NAD(P)-dependent oxidoreductase [Gemmataceae bacterium]